MKYSLIVKKLNLDGEKFIDADLLINYSEKVGLKYEDVVRYLLTNKYIHRIMRGIFYVPSIEERKLKKIGISIYEAVAKAMEMKEVNNWYFGLESALKLNNLTHEFFVNEYVVSDTIFREKAFTILGRKVKFVKLKKGLMGFGIRREKVPYSDPEKTLLDMIYLAKYNGETNLEINNRISEILPKCSKGILSSYAKHYNKEIVEFVKKQ
jgi:predicted transcriptional regulator of viral defense system